MSTWNTIARSKRVEWRRNRERLGWLQEQHYGWMRSVGRRLVEGWANEQVRIYADRTPLEINTPAVGPPWIKWSPITPQDDEGGE